MTAVELRNLVNDNYENIVDALREADRLAMKYPTFKYSVVLFPDGHIEQRERLAGDNWWYVNDPAILVLGGFCYQYYDVLRDNLASDELLEWLESEMEPDEKVNYTGWRERYEETEDEEPDDYDAVNWIEEHNFELWERVRDKAIDEILSEPEVRDGYEEILENELDLVLSCELD